MFAKSLILFSRIGCRENGQAWQVLEKSRAWVNLAQLAHKVIHKKCGQQRKRFSIIDLGVISHMIPSFRAQLRLDGR
jgi:hypothetical protein